jgi:hypothetical protein
MCLVPKKLIPNLGTPTDMELRLTTAHKDDGERRQLVSAARAFIYKNGLAVKSKKVEDILGEQSLVPIQVSTTHYNSKAELSLYLTLKTAFSRQLGKAGFDIHKAIVVDLLHEVELGVWKSLFTHLIRMLHSKDKALTIKLDER